MEKCVKCGCSERYTDGRCAVCTRRAAAAIRLRLRPVDRRALRIEQQAKDHGLTVKQLRDMFKKQGGCCAVCRDSFGTFEERTQRVCIDHDHRCCPSNKRSCGKCVRGLLCMGCNRDLGAVEKSKEHLDALLKYVAEGFTPKPPSRTTLWRRKRAAHSFRAIWLGCRENKLVSAG